MAKDPAAWLHDTRRAIEETRALIQRVRANRLADEQLAAEFRRALDEWRKLLRRLPDPQRPWSR